MKSWMPQTPTIREGEVRTTGRRRRAGGLTAIEEQRRWMTVAAGVTVILVLAFVFYLLRYVILPFGVAAALAFLAAPLVRWFERKRNFKHWQAALTVYLAYLAVIVLIGLGTWKYVYPEFIGLAENLPDLMQHLLHAMFRSNTIHLMGQTVDARGLTQRATHEVSTLVQNPGNLMTAGLIGISGLVGFFVTLALLGYFLFQGPSLAAGVIWLMPPRHRRRARVLAAEVEPVVYNYVRGVIVIVAYAMVVTGLVTGLILHLPQAILLAVCVGLLESIPMVGPALALMLLGLVVAEHATPALLAGFAAFATGLRLSIDNLLAPLVLGKYVMLPPPVIIFAFLAGGVLFGFVGVLLAIPIAAAVKVVLADLYGDRRLISQLRRGSAVARQPARGK